MSEIDSFMARLVQWFDDHEIEHRVTSVERIIDIQFLSAGQWFGILVYTRDADTAMLEDLQVRFLRTIRCYSGQKAIDAAINEVLADE